MNSSTPEPQSGAIDFKDFTTRRMLHVDPAIIYCFYYCLLDRVNIAYAGLTMKENLPWLTPEVFGMGAGIFFIGYVLFEVPASLIAARCNAMHWVARIMFSWGLVCILMTTMTTDWEFYIYRFLLGLCEASLYPVIYSLLIPNWFLPKERAKAISLMLTSLLFSNIIGGPLAVSYLIQHSLVFMAGAHSLSLKLFLLLSLRSFFAFWMKERPDHASWVTGCRKSVY